MKLIVLLSTLVVQAFMQDIITIEEVGHYEKEVLYNENLYEPKGLIVDYSTNNLYFSNEKERRGDRQPARFNLNTRELIDIEGVRKARAQTIDQKTHDVYLSGEDGIYRYIIDTNKAELIVNATGGITDMCFKDRLYYVNSTTDYVYIVENGRPTRTLRFQQKTTFFLMDNESYMYTIYGFFFIRQKGTSKVFYNGLDLFVHAMNIDKNGKVYACSRDGIYEIMKDSKATFKKIASLDASCLGIAFDNENNIILAEYEEDEGYRIVRLKQITETEDTIVESIPDRTDLRPRSDCAQSDSTIIDLHIKVTASGHVIVANTAGSSSP